MTAPSSGADLIDARFLPASVPTHYRLYRNVIAKNWRSMADGLNVGIIRGKTGSTYDRFGCRLTHRPPPPHRELLPVGVEELGELLHHRSPELLRIHEGDGALVVAGDVVADADREQLDRTVVLDVLDDLAQMPFQVVAGVIARFVRRITLRSLAASSAKRGVSWDSGSTDGRWRAPRPRSSSRSRRSTRYVPIPTARRGRSRVGSGIDHARPGDRLCVIRLDRLGRSLKVFPARAGMNRRARVSAPLRASAGRLRLSAK